MTKNGNQNLFYGVIFTLIFYILFLCKALYGFEPAQVVTITKEDIINAKPSVPDVILNPKELKTIAMLEKRHFLRAYPELSDKERLKNLEYELLGRCWQYTTTKERIRSLKLASVNIMMQGTSLPPSISSRRNAKRLTNDSIQIRKKDDVGLIDGMLRLINPELYEQYRGYSEQMYNKYDD